MSSTIGKRLLPASSICALTSVAFVKTIASGLALNSGASSISKLTEPTSTSAPGRQMKLRPKISGCSVRTKTPTRHSGKPARTRRSQVSAIISAGLAADLAPSISQSVIFCKSEAFMAAVCRKHGRATSEYMYGLADLPAMPQEMIGQHAGHHGLADRHRADADAGVVAALGHDVGVGAACGRRSGAATGSTRSASPQSAPPPAGRWRCRPECRRHGWTGSACRYCRCASRRHFPRPTIPRRQSRRRSRRPSPH